MIFIDALVVKIRGGGQVTNRPIYVVVGVTVSHVNGERDILGLWAGDGGEGAKFWLAVLTDLKNRGVTDVHGRPRRSARTTRVDHHNLVVRAGADVINRHWAVAGWSRRSPRHRERTYADACLRGPHADLSLLVEAGRVVASGSCASSAVMRFQHGPAVGDVSGKDVASAGLISGRICCGGRDVRRHRLG